MQMGEEQKTQQIQLSTRKKGGLRTMPFIIVNEAFEKVASYGLLPNMILYLRYDYNIGVATSTNILFLWSAASNFAPIVGAFLSDSYMGRFVTIGLGSLFSLLGMILLWLTTMVPQLKPPPCNQKTETCKQPTQPQYVFLIFAFIFMSIGAGGVRACSLAFGAEQIDHKDNPNNKRSLESFFGWYYASSGIAVLISFTGIVYIQDHAGWKIGFGIPAILMLLSVILFFVASSLYIKMKVKRSIFTSFVQVIVASFKNRKIAIGLSPKWHHLPEDPKTVPTKKIRFLNKACIIQNPKDVTLNGIASNPWRLCTVDQVEELKSLIRVIPLWSASLMSSINISQSSFPTLQANSMDRHLASTSFQIPAGSFAFFTIITIVIWVILYDRAIIPIASKIRGKKVHLRIKVRMGIGLVFSTLAMVVSAIVEHTRRTKAIEQGLINDTHTVMKMSAMWLIPQHFLNGLAEGFNAIGQNEFYYSEFPKSMASIAGSIFGVGMGLANLLASVILTTVEKTTKGNDGKGWITTNINEACYDGYYWILAIMSFVNLFYFVACSWAYGPCANEKVKDEHSEDPKEDLARTRSLESDLEN